MFKKLRFEIEIEGNFKPGDSEKIKSNLTDHIFEEARCFVPAFTQIDRCAVKLKEANG